MITEKNVPKIMEGILYKVKENEKNPLKRKQIDDTIEFLNSRVKKNEITNSECTREILLSMINISDSDVVNMIIRTESCLSIIDDTY